MSGIEPWMIECRDQRIKELEGLLKETQKEQDQIGHALGICYCADDRCHGAGPIEAMLEEIHELQRIRNPLILSRRCPSQKGTEVDSTDKKVEDALMRQRDTAVEALVWAFEQREGWHMKVAEAISIMPESLIACINRR